MAIEDLLNDPPTIHGHGDVSFQLSDEVLRFIDERVRHRSSVTLETGAGVSSIVFALNHSRHFCITPDAAQAERITAYCQRHGIATDALHFEIGRSEEVLPRLSVPRLDLVLIDGRHGFPSPFIDWYYTAPILKPGGLLIIDDVQLWTGHELRSFLAGEREWKLERDFGSRATAFIKVCEGSHDKSWTEQTYFAERTAALQRDSRRRRRVDRIRRAAELLRNGDFRKLATYIARRW
jgi:methyltransferase family protein